MKLEKKLRPDQLSGVLSKGSLPEMSEEKNYYAANIFFSFLALFVQKSAGLETDWARTQVTVQYTDTRNEV